MPPNTQTEGKNNPFAHHGVTRLVPHAGDGKLAVPAQPGSQAADVLADSISVAVIRLER